MTKPTLYIFSGLPAAGKSSLAKLLAREINATFLRIDTIEQGLRDLCNLSVEGQGYRLTYRIAADNLKAGNNVIADSCNPIQLTRDEWNQVAVDAEASFVNIQVVCSDTKEHQKRVETRINEIENLNLPSWSQIQNREYHDWTQERIVIDTAGEAVEESFKRLLELIKPEN